MSPAVPIALPFWSQSFKMSAPDPRADGGTRQIKVSWRGVRIERHISGIQILLAVPIHAYAGVVLTCDETVEPRLYRVNLVHPDPDLTIELHCEADSPSIVPIWRNWAEFFGKTAIYGDGQAELYRFGRPRPRRRGDLIPKRRPRFLKRRGGGWASKAARGGGRYAFG